MKEKARVADDQTQTLDFAPKTTYSFTFEGIESAVNMR